MTTFKKIVAVAVCAFSALTLTACNKTATSTESGSGEYDKTYSDEMSESQENSFSASDIVSDVGKFVEAGGREYGKTYTNEMGESQDNTFFSTVVKDAYRLKGFSGSYDGDDRIYEVLVVDVEVTNISDDILPMSCYDFTIRWGEGEDDFDTIFSLEGEEYGLSVSNFPEEFYLDKYESFRGCVYFAVPTTATELKLEYIELWEDDFEGNTYHINLGNPSYK